MSKKMTLKEFKEIFNECGHNFEVWGYEGILNLIAIADYQDAKDMEKEGLMAGAKALRSKANYITNVLEERGYFKD